MIVGLLDSLRGEEAAAAKAFETAERLAPENALASYYLGQTLVLQGQSNSSSRTMNACRNRSRRHCSKKKRLTPRCLASTSWLNR